MPETSVSDAELAALIANLTTPATPAPEPTSLPVAELAGPQPGPWFSAAYPGYCTSCGARFELFERIRADGAGGWLATCCGDHDEQTTTDTTGLIADPEPHLGDPVAGPPPPAPRTVPAVPLAACSCPGDEDGVGHSHACKHWATQMPPASPPIPAGPPTSTVKELRQVLIDFEASRPRSMQVALGPSELGTPCQQQIARKLTGAPRRPITAPTWAPFQGTAVHRSMEDVVAFWNAQLGRERWLAEDRLYIDPGMPDLGIDPIEGNGDAFDTDWAMVVDWKHTGKTARDKLARAKRMGKPPVEQVSAEYRIQAHLYGYGHARKGRDVRHVRLVLLARDYDYDQSQEWTEPYDPNIAIAAIDRYYATHELLAALNVTAEPEFITAVPAAPSRDGCKWCPFHRPGQPTDWAGCAGDRTPEKHVELATKGLIDAP